MNFGDGTIERIRKISQHKRKDGELSHGGLSWIEEAVASGSLRQDELLIVE